MKHIIRIVLLAASSLAVATGAPAQEPVTQASVPFAFSVGRQMLPAGTYLIRQLDRSLISVRNKNDGSAAFALVTPGYDVRQDPNMLVFHKYGDRYFLSEIHGDAGQAATTLHPSKLEKQIQQQQWAGIEAQNTEIALK